MGSLVGGWDATQPGRAPKGFEDFKEPYTPRSHKAASPFDTEPSGDLDKDKSGPPHLARVSAPPCHGAVAVQRYLTRTSTGTGAAMPASPRVGSPGSPRSTSARSAPKHLTLKVGDSDEPFTSVSAREKWCTRMDSATLNLRPDEVDSESWRHAGFKVDDPCHAMHLPGSPRALAETAAEGLAPYTPPAAAAAEPVPEPRVTAMRLPHEAVESFESAGL